MRQIPSDLNPKPPADVETGKSLTNVLEEAEHVKELVEQSALELSAINTDLAHEMVPNDLPLGMRQALKKTQAVEGKVQEASDKLSVVNLALEAEVSARHALEGHLASLTLEEEAARHAALHDPLTGLPNRTLFENRLEHGLAQAKRHDRILAVLFLDLDGFKAINDLHGHDVGDVVLQTMADRLKEHAREDDTVSRFGGDEFLYLLTEIDNDQDVLHVAKKIANSIQLPCRLSIGEINLSASIGIAIFPKDGNSVSTLIKSSDTAMYKAKRGKTGYAFAS
jgi:diguanylate cyclase (GGDEF)-like protein